MYKNGIDKYGSPVYFHLSDIVVYSNMDIREVRLINETLLRGGVLCFTVFILPFLVVFLGFS